MISTIEIQSALEGIDYPAHKEEIIKHAKQKGANKEIIDALENLPEQSYNDAAEVSSQLKDNGIGENESNTSEEV